MRGPDPHISWPIRGEMPGRPVVTINRGRRVMWDGEIAGPAGGEAVRFQEALG